MKKMLGILGFLVVLVAWASPAAAQCGVYKTYALNEILASADLNASFTRTVTANVATCTVGYSLTVSQMRTTVDPYPGSTESLASTVGDEFARLRFQLSALVGKTYWYQTVDNSLAKDVSKHWGATFTKYTEIADPATPATNNELALYAKDDGAGVTVLAYKDSAGNVTALTGASTSYGSAITMNLKIIRNAGSPTTKLDITASRLSIEGYITASYSKTIDTSTTGADALDTGTLSASKLYYVWAIYKPSSGTPASLLSLSETAPTMPSGYTKKRVLGAAITDGSSHFLDSVQIGNQCFYTVPIKVVSAGIDVVATPILLASYVPNLSVKNVTLTGLPSSTPTRIDFHWTTFTIGVANAIASIGGSSPAGLVANGQVRVPTNNSTPSTIYYGLPNANAVDVYLVGWEMEWRE